MAPLPTAGSSWHISTISKLDEPNAALKMKYFDVSPSSRKENQPALISSSRMPQPRQYVAAVTFAPPEGLRGHQTAGQSPGLNPDLIELPQYRFGEGASWNSWMLPGGTDQEDISGEAACWNPSCQVESAGSKAITQPW